MEPDRFSPVPFWDTAIPKDPTQPIFLGFFACLSIDRIATTPLIFVYGGLHREDNFREVYMGLNITFQVGERVVYPNHGIGTIENISTRVFGPKTERFYLLRLASSSLTIMIPFSHVSDVGLRRITRNSDIQRTLDFLSSGLCAQCADWKDRFKENTEKMRVGALLEVAEVLKGLLMQQKSKPLSFREKKMLDRARHMLLTEISSSRGVTMEQATEVLKRVVGKNGLTLPEPL